MRRRVRRAGVAAIAVVVVLVLAPLLAPAARAHELPTCPVPTTYRVRPGDTLSLIATRFGTDVATLVALNGLHDPDHIEVGQVLVLPCPVQAPDQAVAAALAGIAVGQVLPQGEGRPWLTLWQARARALETLHAQGVKDFVTWEPAMPVPGDAVVLRVWPQASTVVTPSVRILDTWYPMSPAADGFVAFVPLHGFVQPGLLGITVRWSDKAQVDLPVWVREKAFPVQTIMLPASKSALLDPDIVQAEARRLSTVWVQDLGPPRWQGAFQWPLDPDTWPTTAPYGVRRSYNGGPVSSYHTGQDIAAPEGTPVYAPAPGIVLLAERLNVRGNAVVLGHGAGVTSNYWHLSGLAVRAGQTVRAGDLLGWVGTTGLSTGPHLHWEIRVYGVPVDPVPWTRGWSLFRNPP